jgi:hypothetical protein
MLPWVLMASACAPLTPTEQVLLIVTAPPGTSPDVVQALDDQVRRLPVQWLPSEITDGTLTQESGASARRRTVLQARARIRRAESLFRELEDDRALDLLTRSITELTAVHQEADAVALLAQSHLLSGAIFMARGRRDAARSRLRRALDLDPELAPSPARFSPRVLAELAALRATEDARARGRLEVEVDLPEATVFIDGRPRGRAPLRLDDVPVGRHLLRVSAPAHRSYLTTFSVRSDRTRLLDVRLSIDVETRAISQVQNRMAADEPMDDMLTQLTRRSGADRTVVISMVPSDATSVDGRGQWAARIAIQASGSQIVHDLSTLPSRLLTLSRCQGLEANEGLFSVPALLDPSIPVAVAARPRRRAWYERSWVWAAAGGVLLGATVAVVAARSSGGPPDSVQVDVIPRP